MSSILILFGNLAFALGTYLIWPSRWNIFAHLQLGFASVAFLIPLFYQDVTSSFPNDLVDTYAIMVSMGGATYLFGLILGSRIRTGLSLRLWLTDVVDGRRFASNIASKTCILTMICIAFLWFSFLYMGFIPALANNPMMAKFLRGEYQEPYRDVAVFYRLALILLPILTSFCLCLWAIRQGKIFAILSVVAIASMLLTLQRGTAAWGVLVFAGVFAATYRGYLKLFLAFVIVVFGFGSALNTIFYWSFYGQPWPVGGLLAAVGDGAPDITDHLNFLAAFFKHPEFNYGRTFVGGLIPYQYEWSPGVYTLRILNNSTDISNAASGGLRLPIAIWGYAAFGWIGVVVIPLLSGLLLGVFTDYIRRKMRPGFLLENLLLQQLYMTAFFSLASFYVTNIYMIPPAALLIWLLYTVQRRVPQPRRQYSGLSYESPS